MQLTKIVTAVTMMIAMTSAVLLESKSQIGAQVGKLCTPGDTIDNWIGHAKCELVNGKEKWVYSAKEED